MYTYIYLSIYLSIYLYIYAYTYIYTITGRAIASKINMYADLCLVSL